MSGEDFVPTCDCPNQDGTKMTVEDLPESVTQRVGQLVIERDALLAAAKQVLPFIEGMRSWVPDMAEEAGWDDDEDHADMMDKIETHAAALREALATAEKPGV